jgi:hypothetical protein
MKTMLRSMGALLLLAAFAAPLCAQNPNVAIRLYPSKECVKGTFKNLTTTTIGVSYVELWIYDAKSCKRICATRKVLSQKIEPCNTLEFDLCCPNTPSASGYIYYVRVHHSAGTNEQWAFAP